MATNFIEHSISKINLNDTIYNLKSVPFHATEAEWSLINYIPKAGETVVYDIDDTHNYLRFKTGDGLTQAKLLPFSLVTLTEIQNYINSVGHLKRIVLEAGQDLPSVENAQIDTIYMKPKSDTVIPDIYDEYMVINGAWELIGNTQVDLSNYVTKDYADNTYLQSIVAGEGLKVSQNNKIEIDTDVVFVFNAGTSTEVI